MTIFAITAGGCWVLLSLLVMARFAHILQAERYHNDSYLKWVLDGGALKVYSPKRFDRFVHFLSIAMTASAFFSPYRVNIEFGFLSAIAIYWIAVHIHPEREVKKPFVITARVKRLFIFTLFLEALYLLGMYSYGERAMVASTVLLAYMQPFFLASGNLVVLPVEKLFQRRFKKEAKSKIIGKKVIAITGSYGKTGTKEAVAHLLETSFPLLKTPGSYNTPMGLCRVINEQMEPYHELFIAEMGARKRGDIKELCGFVPPSIGLITSTGDAHLEIFRSLENVAKTKFELADALPPDGVLVFNSDYGAARELAEGRTQKSITYGFETEADYMPRNINCNSGGSTFDLVTPEGEVKDVKIGLLGKLNVINVTAAFAVGCLLGVPVSRLKAAAATLPQMESRLQLIPNPGSYLIINDGFNSNALGAVAAVETLSYFKGYKKVMVTPGIVELGKKHEEINFDFGRSAAKFCDRAVLINERRTKPLKNGLRSGGMSQSAIETFPTLAQAREFIEEVADEKTVVLFENDLPDHMEDF